MDRDLVTLRRVFAENRGHLGCGWRLRHLFKHIQLSSSAGSLSYNQAGSHLDFSILSSQITVCLGLPSLTLLVKKNNDILAQKGQVLTSLSEFIPKCVCACSALWPDVLVNKLGS